MAVGDLGSVGFGKAGSGWRVRREYEDEIYHCVVNRRRYGVTSNGEKELCHCVVKRRNGSAETGFGDELIHYAVKGQKKGVRRYQNEDGSYTAAGRAHYGIGEGRTPAAAVAPVTSTVKQKRSIVPAQKAASTRTNNVVGNYGRGNIDLNKRKVVQNEDGSISTERSFSVNIDGKEVLLPTVVNGRIVSEDEAIDHYFRTGEHLGQFNTPEEAEEYAIRLHNRQDWFYSKNLPPRERMKMLLRRRRMMSGRSRKTTIVKSGKKLP